jgi:hypothetical protein
MLIGDDSVLWWDVVCASSWILMKKYLADGMAPQFILRPSVILSFVYDTTELSLSNVLTTYNMVSFLATDPRDKIFALLSHSCEEEDVRRL